MKRQYSIDSTPVATKNLASDETSAVRNSVSFCGPFFMHTFSPNLNGYSMEVIDSSGHLK